MIGKGSLLAAVVLFLVAPFACGQPAPVFDAAKLLKTGDAVVYGSYNVIKIGEGIFQINDPGDPKAKLGGKVGADMYLVLGKSKALLIDLGNNYIDGYTGDEIPPRKNAAVELLALVDGLVGKLQLEVAITHAHPDHDGMTGAFLARKTILWMPKGEDMEAPRKQHNIDPAVYTVFDHESKTFDLGGGRIVKPLLVRGHSNGCTVYLLTSDLMLFTGDALGVGAGRSLSSAAQLKVWGEDTARLVSYIRANLTPFQRYGLKVYTGHNAGSPIAGFVSPNHGRLDLAYLDWRFVQDQALCAAAILKGQWLIPDSGLRLQVIVNPMSGRKIMVMLYGIGAVEIPITEAYLAAGLKMTE